ncbi:MAG TPA: autotransporter-associated beta strand repeat-containing protein [Verrucomicrobiae bacterium]|nr:autotransporter-associated beta strand repeat-containing protein [Verrucomicrobiae bacterium]
MKLHLSLKATLCALTLVGAMTGHAQNGMWTNAFNSIWSEPTNWLNNVVASGSGNVATFSNELAAAVEVSLDSSRTIAELRFVQGAYTITNDNNDANVLTLAGGSKPVIYVDPALGTPATLRQVVLAGANGFVLDGGGTLNLFKENTNLANTITGDVVLSNGTIQVQGINVDADNDANTLALNSITSFTFINGTVNLQPAVNTTPQYGNVNGSLHVPEGGVGTIVLPVRFSGAAGDNSAAPGNGLGGNLTGSGTFNVRARYVRGNVVGDWSAFTGLLDIGPSSPNADNTFRVGNPAGYPDARVNFSGTTPIAFFYYRQLTSNTNMRMGVLSGENPQAFLNGSASAAFTLFYEVGAVHTQPTDTATFAGVIGNAAGPAGLIKLGAGTLILTGNNTFSGSTTISNGVLQIGDGFSDSGAIGTGPVTNYSTLIFARGGGGNLDVPGPIRGPGAITNIGFGGTLTLRGSNTYSAPTVSTAGKLVVGTASRATGDYILQDAAEGFGVLMSSPGATLTISSLSYGQAGTFDANFAGFGNPSAAVVTNTGNLALNGDVTVNVIGDNLTLGTITLLQYNSRSGTGTFVPGTVPPHVTGFTINDDTVNKRVTLTITETFDNTLQWIGDGAGIWDIDNPANQVWRVVGSGQVTNYYDGAKVRFDDTATGATTIDVSAFVSPLSVTVNNSSLAYKFAGAGSIAGEGTLIKQGNNKLTIVNQNLYTGLTRIDGGTLEIGDGVADGMIGTGVVTNHGTILFNLAVGPQTAANPIHGTGNVVVSGVGPVNLSGASTYSGGLTVRSNASFGNNNGNAAGIGGGLRVEQATVTLNADVFNNVGQLVIITNAVFLNTGTANRNIDIPVFGTNVNILFDKPNSANALITLNRDISNISGNITNQGLGGLRFNSGGGNNATGSTNAVWDLVTAGGGFLQPRNASVNSLGAVTGTGTFSAQQSGNGTVTWLVGGLNTSTTFEGVVSDGSSFAQLGRYTALTKVGSGTWTLNNATLSYRGSTTVSNGVMALTGSSHPDVSTNIVLVAPGVLNVSARTDGTLTLGAGDTNQVLRGDGTLQGNLVLGANGQLMPGFSTGVLTVNGSAQLGGVTTMEVSRGTTPNSDRLAATSVTFGGDLVVTNIGGILAPGDTFQLFAGTISGTFSSITLPNLNCPTLSWNTSNLGVNGTISVTGTSCVSTTPTNITFSVVGSQLHLQWPANYIGWVLQGQTNTLNVGLNNGWVNVPNSETTNEVFIPLNPANPAVFYRLTLP